MIRPALLVTALCTAAYVASAQVPSDPSPIELALFGPDRPVRVRLHVSLDGRPIVQSWRTHIENWFRFLDRAPMEATCRDLTGIFVTRLGDFGVVVADGAAAVAEVLVAVSFGPSDAMLRLPLTAAAGQPVGDGGPGR